MTNLKMHQKDLALNNENDQNGDDDFDQTVDQDFISLYDALAKEKRKIH